MLKRDCAEVRPHLSAFHDEELPVEERIAISAHLQDCPGCALEAEDLRMIRDALRGAGAAIQAGWSPELSGMPCGAPGRVKAERDESLAGRLSRLWDDPQRLWTTCGAVVASTACAVFVVGVLAEAARDRADSLAAAVKAMVEAGHVPVYGPLVLPRVNSDAVMPAAVMSQEEGDDAVSAFAAVVRPDGSLVDLQLLEAEDAVGTPRAKTERVRIGLLAAAATARFEPARIAGAPVAVSVVWLVAHTTVRGRLPDGKPGGWSPADLMRPDPRPRARRQRLS